MAKPKKSIEELRETGRKRAERFHEKQKKAKRQQISGYVSEQAYNELCRIRDKTGQSVGQIFENFLLDTINVNMDKIVNIDVNINTGKKGLISPVKVEPREKPEIETVPDYQDEGYKNYIIDIVRKLKDEGLTFRQITAELENRGLKTLAGKDKWNPGTISKWI